MSSPSPYTAIPRAQRPPNRRGTGRKAVSKGEKQAIAMLGLSGEVSQAQIARDFNRSRDFVKRCVEQARTLDPDQALVLRRALPDRYLTAAYLSNERAIEAIEANEPAEATKWAFTSKLQTESNRWADKIGDGTGATMLEFIKALNEAGGGSITVSVEGAGSEDGSGVNAASAHNGFSGERSSAEALPDTVIDVEASRA